MAPSEIGVSLKLNELSSHTQAPSMGMNQFEQSNDAKRALRGLHKRKSPPFPSWTHLRHRCFVAVACFAAISSIGRSCIIRVTATDLLQDDRLIGAQRDELPARPGPLQW